MHSLSTTIVIPGCVTDISGIPRGARQYCVLFQGQGPVSLSAAGNIVFLVAGAISDGVTQSSPLIPPIISLHHIGLAEQSGGGKRTDQSASSCSTHSPQVFGVYACCNNIACLPVQRDSPPGGAG